MLKEINDASFDLFRPYDNLFLKPNEDGSSVDIFKINDEDSIKKVIMQNVKILIEVSLIEEFIDGREITVTVIGKDCFPPVEIINNEFYDYDAKYVSDETLHIEAKLSLSELNDIKLISKKFLMFWIVKGGLE